MRKSRFTDQQIARRLLMGLLLLALPLTFLAPYEAWGDARLVASNIVVTRFDDPAPGACSSADCSLREAIILANFREGPDVIELQSGRYVLSIAGTGEDMSASGDLDIRDGVTIVGSGASGTTIDGGGLDRVMQVFSLPSAAMSVEVSFLTITGGKALFETNLLSGSGGGMLIAAGANVKLEGVSVVANSADLRGGGISSRAGHALDGYLTLVDSLVTQNQAGPDSGTGVGGGIYTDGRASLIDSTVSLNEALAGGGIDSSNGSLEVVDSEIISNEAGIAAGIAAGDELVISGSLLANNTARNSGGAILGAGEGMTITNSTISNNAAGQEGGGIDFSGGLLLAITDSAITGNVAGTYGGALFSWVGGAVEFTNVTVSGNTAGEAGGGLYVQSGTAELTNVTLTDSGSPAGPTGSGIFNGVATVSVTNSILAENAGGDDCTGLVVSSGHNLDGAATCGFSAEGDISNVDPLLGPLLNNGGPTNTHALLAGSPAVDVGDDSSCPGVDQRGFPRPVDGDNDGTATCDIGAYEAQVSVCQLPGDVNRDGVVNAVDAALVLQRTAGLLQSLTCPGDVNGDGETNSLDALLILQLAAGLIPHLPQP